MAGATYLADTSVFVLQAQHAQVHQRFADLLSQGRLAACQMTTLEYLNNARDPTSYEIVWGALHGTRWKCIARWPGQANTATSAYPTSS